MSDSKLPESPAPSSESYEYFYHFDRAKQVTEDWKSCADCNNNHPNWAEILRGILICSKCAGVHRSFGTHISQVRSLTIDKWKLSWIENLIPNDIYFNEIWEYHVPNDIKKPTVFTERAEREKFISSKYLKSCSFHKKNFNSTKRLIPVFEDSFTGMLRMHVKSGRDMPKADFFSDSDPYVILDNGSQRVKSAVIDNNNNPIWTNEYLLIPIDISKPLRIEIFDEDVLMPDYMLCWQEIDINEAINNNKNNARDIEFVDLDMNVHPKWKKHKKQSKFTFTITYNHMTGNHLFKSKSVSSNSNNNTNNSSNISSNKYKKMKPSIINGGVSSSSVNTAQKHPFKDHRSESVLNSGMIEYTGVLDIHVMGAMDLPKADVLSDSDPYVVFDNGHQLVKTQVIQDDNNPVWNAHLVLSVNDEEAIKISIYDEDLMTADDLLCWQYLDVGEQCVEGKKTEFHDFPMVLKHKYDKQLVKPKLTFNVKYDKMG